MKTEPIIPVILSGGAGLRLWPLSNADRPKQFHRFGSAHSLIQETLLRCQNSVFDARPIIVSGEHQRFLVAEAVREIGLAADIVLEPVGRDSCAAVTAGCLLALERSEDALVLIVAADHYIPDKQAFAEAVAQARIDAEAGYLTSFGIVPHHPATGYGYIQSGESLGAGRGNAILQFVEKPDVARAKDYVQRGFLWNSGNFLFQAKDFIAEVKLHNPDVFEAVRLATQTASHDHDFIRLAPGHFAAAPRISVDYAVMEKTSRAAVFPVNYQWSDVGSWDSVFELLPKDAQSNAVIGQCLAFSAQNNLVWGAEKAIHLVGVDDLIVVDRPDALLVTRRGQAGELKYHVENIRSQRTPKTD